MAIILTDGKHSAAEYMDLVREAGGALTEEVEAKVEAAKAKTEALLEGQSM